MLLDQILSPQQLYTPVDPELFSFKTTDELEDKHEIIGQERAVKAIQFGIGIQHDGYNLFALGPNGTGKYTALSRYLHSIASEQETADDWCYVFNFQEPHKPNALRLPPGRAAVFKSDMKRLVEEMLTVLPATFSSDEYRAQAQLLEEEFKSKQTRALEQLREVARENDIAFIQTPGGFAFAPLRDGEVVSPEDFLKYPPEEQKKIEDQVHMLQDSLQDIMRQVPQWQRHAQEELTRLKRKVADFSISPLFEELQSTYESLEEVTQYLRDVKGDVVENIDAFLEDGPTAPASITGIASSHPQTVTFRYHVNVVVDNGGSSGAPVIFEDQPRYQNLVGRVEYVSQMGTLLTDFTLIKPGALHRANGGYLVLDARKLLMQTYAWEGLKNVLRSGKISIESLGQVYSMVSTVSLDPEAIPLKIKVILVGDRTIYYLLYQYDPDFGELFKVAADFEDDMERNEENCLAYARLVGALARKEKLRHFERAAVARVLEHSSRVAGDAQKLSVHMQSMSDLMREADYWAGKGEREVVTLTDVQQALDSQVYRSSRLRDRIQESILRQSILIDTEGSRIGQINALAVYETGQFSFGKPSRITARVRFGKGEVVDIERQVEMGGPIHSKGVMILSGFLGARYAAERPLSLSATLVFEQTYAGVEGDSASAAELFVLLSALADLPIRQSLAVTGSINQLGQVQAIGGVNEKIEGFYDLCHARGLTGDQGVIIPRSNVKNLMLRQDVVQSVYDGAFSVYAVSHVDEGLQILTGLEAGVLNEKGEYPHESINGRVSAKLDSLAETQRAFAAAPDK